MKNLKGALLIVIAIFTFSACGSANVVNYDQADLYLAKSSAFKIDFSGEPKVVNEVVETESGDIPVAYYVDEADGGVTYMVTYSAYPDEVFKSLNKEGILEGAIQGGLNAWGIETPKESNEISLNGYKGLYYRADNAKNFVVGSLYLVQNKLYQIVVVSEGAYVSDELANGFISSFQLL